MLPPVHLSEIITTQKYPRHLKHDANNDHKIIKRGNVQYKLM